MENLARVEQSHDAGTAIVRTRLWDTQGAKAMELVDFAPRFITTQTGRTGRATGASCSGHCWAPTGPIRRARAATGGWQRRASRAAVITCACLAGHHLAADDTNVPLTYPPTAPGSLLHRPVSLLLGPDETLDDGIEETARASRNRPSCHWRQWTHRLAFPLEWRDAVIRAAITLKLCQYEETGAIVAAMTTNPRSAQQRPQLGLPLLLAARRLRGAGAQQPVEVGTMESYLNWL